MTVICVGLIITLKLNIFKGKNGEYGNYDIIKAQPDRGISPSLLGIMPFPFLKNTHQYGPVPRFFPENSRIKKDPVTSTGSR